MGEWKDAHEIYCHIEVLLTQLPSCVKDIKIRRSFMPHSPLKKKKDSLSHFLNPFVTLQGFSRQQMSQVEKTSMVIEEREKEIISIVQSISEINEMFRDLATLVVDQVQLIFNLSPSVTHLPSFLFQPCFFPHSLLVYSSSLPFTVFVFSNSSHLPTRLPSHLLSHHFPPLNSFFAFPSPLPFIKV